MNIRLIMKTTHWGDALHVLNAMSHQMPPLADCCTLGSLKKDLALCVYRQCVSRNRWIVIFPSDYIWIMSYDTKCDLLFRTFEKPYESQERFQVVATFRDGKKNPELRSTPGRIKSNCKQRQLARQSCRNCSNYKTHWGTHWHSQNHCSSQNYACF